MDDHIAILPECIIPCVDLWPYGTLTQEKMAAYKVLEAEKKIARIHVTYSKTSRHTIIEYMSGIPHQWTLDALKQIAL